MSLLNVIMNGGWKIIVSYVEKELLRCVGLVQKHETQGNGVTLLS